MHRFTTQCGRALPARFGKIHKEHIAIELEVPENVHLAVGSLVYGNRPHTLQIHSSIEVK